MSVKMIFYSFLATDLIYISLIIYFAVTFRLRGDKIKQFLSENHADEVSKYIGCDLNSTQIKELKFRTKLGKFVREYKGITNPKYVQLRRDFYFYYRLFLYTLHIGGALLCLLLIIIFPLIAEYMENPNRILNMSKIFLILFSGLSVYFYFKDRATHIEKLS